MATIHPQPATEPLPPGWECRFDPRTGRYYFINHAEHVTTWDDPRLRHNPLAQGYPTYIGPIHYPAAPAPSSSSAPPPQPGNSPKKISASYTPYYGSPRTPLRFKPDCAAVQVDERLLMKLCLQFPTVEEGHIWQLLKQYHNRENVVVSALLAEGNPRVPIHPNAHEQLTPKIQRVEVQSVQIDEAQVHKLRNFFPAVDIESIRNLLRKHNNQEHEVIAALVTGSWKPGSRPSPHPSSPKMKLRYLKLVFPEVDEAVLFDILYNCDNNAYEASKRLTAMGYKKRDTPIIRPNVNQLSKATPEPQRPTLPDRPIILGPPNTADKLLLTNRLQEQFPAISKTLLNMALESSHYNEERAKQFLKAITPQDGSTITELSKADKKLLRKLQKESKEMDAKSKQVASALESESATENAASTVAAPTAAAATEEQSLEPPVAPPRSRHSSSLEGEALSRASSIEGHKDTAREGTSARLSRASTTSPKTEACKEARHRSKFKKEVMKCSEVLHHGIQGMLDNLISCFPASLCDLRVSKATSTQEDQQYLSSNRTYPRGPDSSLRKGPCEDLLLKDYIAWVGPDPKNHCGPNPSHYRGPDPKNLESRSESRAKGPNRDHRRGPLTDITHHTITSSSLYGSSQAIEN